MKFEYFAGEQRTPEWYALRLGKVTASQLHAWLAVSKAKGKEGKPLKARLDYEKELLFERKFNTSFERFVTDAMQDGIDYEAFARQEYMRVTGAVVRPCGAWYNDYFVASPDGVIERPDSKGEGLLEVKIVRDNTFSDILTDGVPDKWMKQIQGQLWASGLGWSDFVAVNFNTKKLKIIRVEPDHEEHKWYELAITEDFHLTDAIFDDSQLFDLSQNTPEAEEEVPIKNRAEKLKLEDF